MGASVPARKLVVPVSFPSFTARTSLGLIVVPSGMAKFQRQEPSSGWVLLASSSSAARTGWTTVAKRTNRTNGILNADFIQSAFYLCATGFDAGTLNLREIFSSFLLLRPL